MADGGLALAELGAQGTDVPFALDILTNEDDKLLSIAAYAPLQSGRPYLMPPGVPADRVAAMQKAMMETFKDPAFVAEANKRGMDVSSPRSSEELRDLLVRVYTKTPDRIVQRLRKISSLVFSSCVGILCRNEKCAVSIAPSRLCTQLQSCHFLETKRFDAGTSPSSSWGSSGT